MEKDKLDRVYLTDHMVLIGFGLAAIYWILDSVLYIFLSYDINFFKNLLGFNLNEIWTRLIVSCLFIINDHFWCFDFMTISIEQNQGNILSL